MKNIAVINLTAVNFSQETPFLLQNLLSRDLPGQDQVVTALSRVFAFVDALPDITEIVVLSTSSVSDLYSETREVIHRHWTRELLTKVLCEVGEGHDHLIFLSGDTPFLDLTLFQKMYQKHLNYFSEYTFADGYPLGLSCDILSCRILPALMNLARENSDSLSRNVIFEIIQKDINAFDLETEISPVDLRQLRICLAADSKRNFTLLQRIYSCFTNNGQTPGVEGILDLVQNHGDDLRTLPAYYSIQISAGCPQSCSYCPYPQVSPDQIDRRDKASFLSLDKLESVLDQIEDLSGDGVVNFSPWGEPSLHPEAADLCMAVLKRKNLRLVIETSGIGWQTGTLEQLIEAGCDRLELIVSLDSLDEDLYRRLRGAGYKESFEFAQKAVQLHPKGTWVQAVRMQQGEAQLEKFYRFWKEKTDQIIIQKYDFFSGRLDQQKVADLSPIIRRPCWHIKRDMVILLNGDVPLCREDLDQKHILGNVHTDSLEFIWNKGQKYYAAHLSGDYPEICRNCDEFYTFNF